MYVHTHSLTHSHGERGREGERSTIKNNKKATTATILDLTYRNTHIAPRHTIPPGDVHEPVPAEDVVAHVDVADVGQPAGHQIVAHDPDLGRRVQHGAGDQEHQAVGVAELEGHEPGVLAHGSAAAGGGGLLCDEPGWVEGRAGPTCDAVRGCQSVSRSFSYSVGFL